MVRHDHVLYIYITFTLFVRISFHTYRLKERQLISIIHLIGHLIKYDQSIGLIVYIYLTSPYRDR